MRLRRHIPAVYPPETPEMRAATDAHNARVMEAHVAAHRRLVAGERAEQRQRDWAAIQGYAVGHRPSSRANLPTRWAFDA